MMWKAKPPVYFPLEEKYKPFLKRLTPPDPITRLRLRRLSPEEEFPDLRGNNTLMGRILTLDMYKRLCYRATEGGVLFDDVIQPGLEEPGDSPGPVSVGCLAGDAQCYITFCDFFDRVIEEYHGYKMSRHQKSDLNYNNLKGGDRLDGLYVLGCEVRVGRSVENFSFPTHCSRGERRELLSLAKKALQQLAQELPGGLHPLEDVSPERLRESLGSQGPPGSLVKTGAARDWPDARAVWFSRDSAVAIWVNVEEHLQLVASRRDSNVRKAFETTCIHLQKLEALYRAMWRPFTWKEHLGWVVSSPANVGTGLRASVEIRLVHMPKNPRIRDILERLRLHMVNTASCSIYRIYSTPSIGCTEVELMQLLVDGVQLLIEMEKTLEEGTTDIEQLIPAYK